LFNNYLGLSSHPGSSSGKRYLRYPDSNVICPFYLGHKIFTRLREKISDFMVLKILFYMRSFWCKRRFFEPVFGEDASFQIV
jgi:hypothetical protein